MSRKRGLGKGLEALIPFDDSATTEAGVSTAPVDAIARNPRQPRSALDESELEELAASIREHGIIQPLIVTERAEHVRGEPGRYTLIAGERRLEAARRAGLAEVPVIVREATEQERLELALIENVQRTDLSPLEAAEAFRQLTEDFGLSHGEIAQRVGKQRVSITNTLRLLKAPRAVRESLAAGQISEGHARALLGLPTPQAQTAALQTVLRKALSVRQTEELVRRLTGEKPQKPPLASPPQPPVIRDLQDRFEQTLGTRVNLKHGKKGGTIVIHYYSDEELNAIAERLLGDD